MNVEVEVSQGTAPSRSGPLILGALLVLAAQGLWSGRTEEALHLCLVGAWARQERDGVFLAAGPLLLALAVIFRGPWAMGWAFLLATSVGDRWGGKRIDFILGALIVVPLLAILVQGWDLTAGAIFTAVSPDRLSPLPVDQVPDFSGSVGNARLMLIGLALGTIAFAPAPVAARLAPMGIALALGLSSCRGTLLLLCVSGAIAVEGVTTATETWRVPFRSLSALALCIVGVAAWPTHGPLSALADEKLPRPPTLDAAPGTGIWLVDLEVSDLVKHALRSRPPGTVTLVDGALPATRSLVRVVTRMEPGFEGRLGDAGFTAVLARWDWPLTSWLRRRPEWIDRGPWVPGVHLFVRRSPGPPVVSAPSSGIARTPVRAIEEALARDNRALALGLARRATAHVPEDPVSHLALARVLTVLGCTAEAGVEIGTVLTLAPDGPLAKAARSLQEPTAR